ncbi:ABC transporter ATP-binding protein [Shimia sp. SDUM112013]|uniref:ABC transporter ATP-binding protein n=1 Tax=Shimia sp. SDUM112013 TaxID=3136160 RepID=UPI0032EFDEBD
MTRPIVKASNLSLALPTPNGPLQILSEVSFEIAAGETLAVVGESGSGKSVTAMSLIKLLPAELADRLNGQISVFGEDLLSLSPRQLRAIRGNRISVIFQEPMTSLNPLATIGRQMIENIRIHNKVSRAEARQQALALLEQVHMPDPEARLNAYPHQLSGGQRQRVMIAMAIANNPELLIADEPTTALDVTTQAQILALLKELQDRYGMAILFITHDLGIVRSFVDRVLVMNRGVVVERGPVQEVFNNPQDAYTRHLLNSEPEGHKTPVGEDAPVILDVENLRVTYSQKKGFLGGKKVVRAVDDISLRLRRGQTLGVVGESGSGKSTLAKAILQIVKSQGKVVFLGDSVNGLDDAGLRPVRRNMQVVFQDPYGALSPRMPIGEFITEPLLVFRPELSKTERYEIAARLLHQVGLDAAHVQRYPHEFSGGQRQRIAIARAVVLEPKLIILDEPTSALDVSVQVQVLELLRSLQRTLGLTYVFISHDLKVVRAVADELIIMQSGKVVERGPTEETIRNPKTAYARQLLSAAFDLTVADPI